VIDARVLLRNTFGLAKLIEGNGFAMSDVYWQPYWKDQVCYVFARKRKGANAGADI
jgi:hypothetical protein